MGAVCHYHYVTVTYLGNARRCRWCGGRFVASAGPGRPQVYCRPSHRQRAYEARRLAAEHRLSEDDVLVSRHSFEQVRDVLYRIESALQDVDADLASGANPDEYRRALWHLYEAAADARVLAFEPKAIGET